MSGIIRIFGERDLNRNTRACNGNLYVNRRFVKYLGVQLVNEWQRLIPFLSLY
jgi:hypothetical protein